MNFVEFIDEMSKKVETWLKRSTTPPNAVIISKDKYEEYKKELYPKTRYTAGTNLDMPSELDYIQLTMNIKLKVIPVQLNHLNGIKLPRLSLLDDSEYEV